VQSGLAPELLAECDRRLHELAVRERENAARFSRLLRRHPELRKRPANFLGEKLPRATPGSAQE
jgi:hypothetical protein